MSAKDNGKGKGGGLGDIAAEVFGNIKNAVPSATRFGVGVVLRTLASKKECIDRIAQTMAEDEDQSWNGMPGQERRNWRLRAKAALIGLDRYLAGAAKEEMDE